MITNIEVDYATGVFELTLDQPFDCKVGDSVSIKGAISEKLQVSSFDSRIYSLGNPIIDNSVEGNIVVDGASNG